MTNLIIRIEHLFLYLPSSSQKRNYVGVDPSRETSLNVLRPRVGSVFSRDSEISDISRVQASNRRQSPLNLNGKRPSATISGDGAVTCLEGDGGSRQRRGILRRPSVVGIFDASGKFHSRFCLVVALAH